MRVPPYVRHRRGCGGAAWPRGDDRGAGTMRSATTKRSSAGFVAFMLGTGGTLVLVIAIIALFGGSSKTPFVPASGGSTSAAPAGGGNDVPAPAGDNAI